MNTTDNPSPNSAMLHRQRVLLAVSHQEPDRVPFDYWATDEVTLKLIEELKLPDKDSLLGHC